MGVWYQKKTELHQLVMIKKVGKNILNLHYNLKIVQVKKDFQNGKHVQVHLVPSIVKELGVQTMVGEHAQVLVVHNHHNLGRIASPKKPHTVEVNAHIQMVRPKLEIAELLYHVQ